MKDSDFSALACAQRKLPMGDTPSFGERPTVRGEITFSVQIAASELSESTLSLSEGGRECHREKVT